MQTTIGFALAVTLGSIWLGDKVGWDSPHFGSWDGMTLFSIWLRRDKIHLFSIWFGAIKKVGLDTDTWAHSSTFFLFLPPRLISFPSIFLFLPPRLISFPSVPIRLAHLHLPCAASKSCVVLTTVTRLELTLATAVTCISPARRQRASCQHSAAVRISLARQR